MTRLTTLRKYIRCVITEKLEGAHIWDKAQGSFVGREQIGSLAADDFEDILPDHLREPELDLEDYFGPVPPSAGEPNVSSDPFTRDYHVIPTRPVYRGR